ncbi:winged helix-turn-helix transcriptional regulator [Mumia sp. Pv 4-285]|uniref:winged helix-turn-helix transcriptional regulator n=1 Tax=Mumia qirimensis TaxID=3234852 RepID=UPI00351D56DC
MRTYSDACGVARALDVVGERWALLVVRELLLGPKRYTDLAVALPGVSTNILGTRLGELEQTGVLTKRKLPPPTAVTVYELTPWGRELEPAILALGRWGAATSEGPSTLSFSASSFILSLRTNFSPARARGVTARFAVRLGDERFAGTVDDGTLAVLRSDDPDVDVEIGGDPKVLASVVYTEATLDAALESGMIAVAGRRDLLDQIIDCFPLPLGAGSR